MYFLISVVVAFVLLIGNYNEGVWAILLITLGALITPFIYELDYFLYVYFVDPESEISKQIRTLMAAKNYSGAFLYSHENAIHFDNTVFRSILMVVCAFSVGFLFLFSPVNFFAKSVILSFLLTTLYLETKSFFEGSWKTWYSFINWIPKEKYAKIFLGLQYLIFLVFLFRVI